MFLLLAALFAALQPATAQQRGPLVLAASSLQEALTDAADRWTRAGHSRPMLSFAASSALARQVQASGPKGSGADLFVSADEEWMDALDRAGLLARGTRADLVGNRLVIVAPVGRPIELRRATLARMLAAGPVAMADPGSVPAGRYGRAALERLGAWAAVAPHVVRVENVRAALALVERGAAPFGIVYLTDARASAKVRLAGYFPSGSHCPIRYPLARLAASTHPQAEGFRQYLLSADGRAVFARYGFGLPR